MSGCCLYCKFAESYWVDKEGNKRRPPKASFGDMNVYCHHPDKVLASSATQSHSQGARFLILIRMSASNAGGNSFHNSSDTGFMQN